MTDERLCTEKQTLVSELESKKSGATGAETIIDLDADDKVLTTEDLNAISAMCIYDELGNRHKIGDIWAEFKTIFVFIRSFLCFTAKEYVEDLALISRQSLKEQQIRLVVIGCANWKHIQNFRRQTRFPYVMFCDVDGDIYKRLGFLTNKEYGKATDSIHVKSSNFKGILNSSYRAFGSDLFDYQGSFSQQGGSLIVGPGNVLHFAHIDKHARDHCPINVLLRKCGISPINFENRNSADKAHQF